MPVARPLGGCAFLSREKTGERQAMKISGPGLESGPNGFERAMALAGAATLKEVLPICVESLLGVSEGCLDCGWVYLIPEKSDVFKLCYSTGVSEAFAEANSSWAPDSVHGRALYRETPWYGAFADTLNGKDPLLFSEGLRAFVILPLFRDLPLAGCFCLASHDHDLIPQSARCDMEALSRWFDKTVARVQVSESRIKESWDLLSLFDAMGEMVFAFGLDGDVLWMNRTAHDELGIERKEENRIHLLDLHPAGSRPEAAQIFRKMLAREQQTSNVPYVRKNGTTVNATTLGVPGRWRGEDVLFGISRIHDVIPSADRDLKSGVTSLETEIARIASIFDERLSRIEEALLLKSSSYRETTRAKRLEE